MLTMIAILACLSKVPEAPSEEELAAAGEESTTAQTNGQSIPHEIAVAPD